MILNESVITNIFIALTELFFGAIFGWSVVEKLLWHICYAEASGEVAQEEGPEKFAFCYFHILMVIIIFCLRL